MADDYARSVSKQVVAQLAEREGFQLAHGNALEALADVLNRFIREIGTYAKDYAELQGRTDVNVLDLADGLHDLGFTPEVIFEYAKQEHTPDPFTHSVPEFPVRRLALQPPTFKSSGDSAPAHIPTHLPTFPAAHTMKFTQMPQLRRTEMQLQQQQQLQSNQVDAPGDTGARDQDSDKPQTAQASLITLQQRMQVTSGAVRANPFLAFRDAPKSPTSDATPSIQKEKSQSVWLPDAMQSFAPKADADNTEAKTGAQRTKRLSAVSGEDTEMCEDEAAEGAATDPSEKETDAGWSLSEVDEHVLMTSTGEGSGLAAGVALYLGSSGASNSVLKDRYSISRRDAFVDEELVRDGASRRRMTLNNPENSKKLRAMDILDTGPDAILMEYPEGYVPRQGTQRAKDDVA